jgi:hypothetical protein
MKKQVKYRLIYWTVYGIFEHVFTAPNERIAEEEAEKMTDGNIIELYAI